MWRWGGCLHKQFRGVRVLWHPGSRIPPGLRDLHASPHPPSTSGLAELYESLGEAAEPALDWRRYLEAAEAAAAGGGSGAALQLLDSEAALGQLTAAFEWDKARWCVQRVCVQGWWHGECQFDERHRIQRGKKGCSPRDS